MQYRVSGGAVVAAMIAIAPMARGQTVAPVHAKPVTGPATQQQIVANATVMAAKPVPASAAAMHAKVSPHLSTPAQSWVQSEARVIAGRNLSSSAMIVMAQSDAKSRFSGQGMSGMDIDQLVQMVMYQVAQDTQNDLRDQLAAVQKSNQQKAAQRAAANVQKEQSAAMKDSLKNHQDQLGDMSEEQQTKMQTVMDRMTQAERALSNMMKRMSETSSGIVSNLK